MSSEADEYGKWLPFLQEASRILGSHLREALAALGDPYLVRASEPDPPRIKPLQSIKRKAKRKRWTFEQALERVNDLVGHRFVCNNLEDVERAVELLQQSLRTKGIGVKRQDHIRRPKTTGYRAVHLDVELPVSVNTETRVVKCEVQLRSLLQDSWARLSRADIYTAEKSFPRRLVRSAKRLAELLSVADQIAQDIREEITRPRRGRRAAKGAPLTEASAAFVFRRAFGQDPPEYVVRSVVREYGTSQVRADAIDSALQDKALLARFAKAYKKHFDWEPDSAQLFRWAVAAAARGTDAAKRLAERQGREDWAEVDAIGRREILSDLPDTWEGLAASIEHHDKDEDPCYDILRWAGVLGGLNHCYICGTEIVDTDELVEALLDHYKLRGKRADDAREKLRNVIFNSGVESGGWSNSSICNYHENVLSKDD
jgi:putative GTP pyrophosphokinase